MNTKKIAILVAFIFILCLIVLPQSLFIVNEWEQALITQLGQYKRTIKTPGLKIKIPFIETVHRFDRRILDSDAIPNEYLTSDKKRLVADHVTRWRIENPLLFYKTVRDELGALARLDVIVYSEMRRELAQNEFADIIATKREHLMENIAANTQGLSKQFGIDVVDVRIKRADLPTEVQASVFARMVAERERIAGGWIAWGGGELGVVSGPHAGIGVPLATQGRL